MRITVSVIKADVGSDGSHTRPSDRMLDVVRGDVAQAMKSGLNLAWDEVRRRAQVKAIEMRSQGWSGAAMLPYSELEYGGFRDTVTGLLEQFRIRGEGAVHRVSHP
jgi:fructose 1,6-bisphosphatase